jgi:hypothetical protein
MILLVRVQFKDFLLLKKLQKNWDFFNEKFNSIKLLTFGGGEIQILDITKLKKNEKKRGKGGGGGGGGLVQIIG